MRGRGLAIWAGRGDWPQARSAVNFLLPLAVLSLFTPFKIQTGLVQLRPFDGLTALMLLITLAKGRLAPRGGFSNGFLVLLPYFAWHVISAFTIGAQNGLREGLQIATVLSFAWVVTIEIENLDYVWLGRVLFAGLSAIMLFTIGWHLAHGFWSDWKRLLDTKESFTFLPLVLACFLIFSRGESRTRYWILWACIGVAVVFSGERKALIVFGLTTATMLARGRLLTFVPVAAAGFAGLLLFSAVTSDALIARQIRTVLLPDEAMQSYRDASHGLTPESYSNAQRTFAAHVASELIAEHPIIGVGTNGYVTQVSQRYSYLPPFMLLGIHGEFLRILTENGMVGFLLYVAIWIAALVRSRRVLRYAAAIGVIDADQASVLQVILFLPPFFYVALEAAGTHSFISLIFVSLLPELLRQVFLQVRERSAGARTERFIPPSRAGVLAAAPGRAP